MSIHKLSAGSGYDYLTRQVAAQDATDKGHTGLASYYAAQGEAPGVWVGSGLDGIDGLDAGDVVTAEQMASLFGGGRHPLAAQRRAQLRGPDLTEKDYQAISRLGAPYKVYAGDVSAFRMQVAQAVAGINEAAGLPGDWPVPLAERARVRTQVAVEFFRAEHGRDPADAREVAATIATHSRPRTTAVAGYDLTFSPVKSVSTLWAIADPATAAVIERAHAGAVQDALGFIEAAALFTRQGANGVRQVNVTGLVAAAFTHRDSRAGDPDLHTHVAVANKVQTHDGRWLAIDGRLIFKANVAASETYNTALEARLTEALGVRFAPRADGDPRTRPVREIVGVEPALTRRWSARRAAIQARRGELAAAFQATHGRPPTPVESIQLAQQATLETRAAKHEPRSLAQQRAAWAAEAADVLGGPAGVRAMLARVLSPSPGRGQHVDAAWLSAAAEQIIAAVQARRATWQVWHAHAEALRQVRGADLARADVARVVDLLVGEVLAVRSVRLTTARDGVEEPAQLRRTDGASMYAVAGADQYTSPAVLAAEARIVARAGQHDGRAVPAHVVEMALLESAANGLTLNAGQAALVRDLATCGARVALAVAPAGSGKTTALRVLAAAWVDDSGTVIGLAPSATAAAALGEQLGQRADTLAKLTWSLAHGDLPGWAAEIGPSTLVVIDEAGMADTLSLDAAIEHVLARGGSVRLIGDDQQLAAIGAGGVLRDIAAAHGAAHLSELMRFTDPAEAAASLALREGRPEALGYYLDHARVHVGDLGTLTDAVFEAWALDRAAGLDSLMLAPTRDLAVELNRRARDHRLAHAPPEAGAAVTLADGNHASVGDVVTTRSNDRRLRVSPTDWVKNGDRWTVLALGRDGSLIVQHRRHALRITLPADYVRASAELGYACTIHTAQGVTADTSHTLLTGGESRQLAYTAATRGRDANHLYLQVVGDGDPHTVITPDATHPPTATDLLERVLARDDSPRSATTLAREHADPATLLTAATARYVDALYVAGEHLLGPQAMQRLDTAAGTLVPGLTDQPAWPALRAHLVLLGAHGTDPTVTLTAAVASRELDSAVDPAAVLDWRLDESGLRNAGPGPLPWIPAVPPPLRADPAWGAYLGARADLVADLAAQVADRAATDPAAPVWARQGQARPAPDVLADVAVWRAATGVDAADRRPTGNPQLGKAAARHQRDLDRAVTGDHAPALAEWSDLLIHVAPSAARDPFAATLAQRLAAISRAGLDAAALLRTASRQGGLPDDHAAAALWWRISAHLPPTVTAYAHSQDLASGWTPRLEEFVGPARAAAIRDSGWWPALVTTVDHALARGNTLEGLLSGPDRGGADVDECQALVWRASLLNDAPPQASEDDGWVEVDPPPQDLWDGVDVPAEPATGAPHTPWSPEQEPPSQPPDPGDGDEEVLAEASAETTLLFAAMARGGITALRPTDAQIRRQGDRADEQDHCPVPLARIAHINALTASYYQDRLPGSWAASYLAGRFGADLAGDPHVRPGYAPAGWTALVAHLRRHGVSDEEMTASGVAVLASTGRLIDRFRDRAIFPITGDGVVLGFVGRRRPDLTEDDKAGPKYLNTAETALFRKGDQLFGVRPDLIADGATPVVVEGPMDAIAVTLASGGRHLGVAPLGTSLTEEQANQLARIGRDPIVATDADLAGQLAAHRDFWLLAQHGMDPRAASFSPGCDPADILATAGAQALNHALDDAGPLSHILLAERVGNLSGPAALREAAAVIAAASPQRWEADGDAVAARLRLPRAQVRIALAAAARSWADDPRTTTGEQLARIPQIRARVAAAATVTPAQRWRALAEQLDARLPEHGDWPALADLLDQAHAAGVDVPTVTRQLVQTAPLGQLPAQDLRYRLVAHVPIDGLPTDPAPRTVPTPAALTMTAAAAPATTTSRGGLDADPWG